MDSEGMRGFLFIVTGHRSEINYTVQALIITVHF
jgi:hypothetical protein